MFASVLAILFGIRVRHCLKDLQLSEPCIRGVVAEVWSDRTSVSLNAATTVTWSNSSRFESFLCDKISGYLKITSHSYRANTRVTDPVVGSDSCTQPAGGVTCWFGSNTLRSRGSATVVYRIQATNRYSKNTIVRSGCRVSCNSFHELRTDFHPKNSSLVQKGNQAGMSKFALF